MISNGKFFVAPSKTSEDFKELFSRLSAMGAGRPVENDQFPPGPWTADLLADAIAQSDPNGAGVELRTVQHWFQDNQKGISIRNIRLLAKVFGCDDPDATGEWQAELIAARRRLAAKRRQQKQVGKTYIETQSSVVSSVNTDLPDKLTRAVIEAEPKKRFNLPRLSEALFSNRSTLNLPASVWAGCVTLGFLAYIMGVHSVTYSPVSGLDKQVGFLWAPNWTLLELVILPLFLVTVVKLLAFWKDRRRSLLAITNTDTDWASQVESFSQSHWAVFFICFFIVFLLQWSGVHLHALLAGDSGNLMMDWSLVAIMRPEVISVPEALVLSMLAFAYTAAICFLYLTGLVFLYTITQDFHEICIGQDWDLDNDQRSLIVKTGTKLMSGVFCCAVLGIWIATCIKIQATYLLSDAEDIVSWLLGDTMFVLGLSTDYSGWLGHRALAHFTSFLLLFATCSVFLFSLIHVRQITRRTLLSNWTPTVVVARFPPWVQMLIVVGLLVANFLLIGLFPGFSVLLILSVGVGIYSLFAPSVRCERARQISTW
ncbi:RcgA family putative transporter [Tateyamaria sp. SN3-11]|uniref:RcgA family putative transporter n=1 Tax=Tateyamaria sp. SN3-11 TaxID=3092147 RepID=UPI0039EC77D0